MVGLIIKFNKYGKIEDVLSGFNPVGYQELIQNSEGQYVGVGYMMAQAYTDIQILGETEISPEHPKLQEIVVENTKKQVQITTEVRAGKGSISGEGATPYESIIYGSSSTLPIVIAPADGWEIKRITENGNIINYTVDENGNVTLPQYTQVKEDKHIEVWFTDPENDYNFEITKKGENDEPLKGAKFTIKKKVYKNNEYVYEDVYDEDGFLIAEKETINGEEMLVVTSDVEGKIKLNLQGGEYQLEEVQAPEDYVLPANVSERIQNIIVPVYEINYIEDLVGFSDSVNSGMSYEGKNVVLMRSLDFNDERSYRNPESKKYGDYNATNGNQSIKDEMTIGSGFPTIGTSGNFKGVFNGNGYEIKNLYMKSKGLGLFGSVSYGTIKNLRLNEINMSTSDNCLAVGGIVDNISYGEISNCSISGKMNITDNLNYSNIDAEIKVGGIAGIVYESEIVNCNSSISINTTHDGEYKSIYIGGIVGESNNSIINKCYNKGSLTVDSSKSRAYVGGVIGRTGSAFSSSEGFRGKTVNSYNTGNITISTDDKAGGIIGYASDEMSNCYNLGDVNNGSALVGMIYQGNRVRNFYSAGKSSRTFLKSHYKNIYYLNSSTTFSSEDAASYAIGKNEDEMKSEEFVQLLNNNITNIKSDIELVPWRYVENSYPTLDIGIDENIEKEFVGRHITSIDITNEKSNVKKITTEILENSDNKRIGGRITGLPTDKENIKFVENVDNGKNSLLDITIQPDEKYKIEKIIINNVEQEFTTNEDGKVILEKFENVKKDIHIQVIFEKIETFRLTKKNESGDILPGAKFTIKQIVENGETVKEQNAIDVNGNIVGKLENINNKELYVVTSDKNGEIILNLPLGKYKIKEVQAPEGYLLENWEQEFLIENSQLKNIWSRSYIKNNASVAKRYTVVPTSDTGSIVIESDGTSISKYDKNNKQEWNTKLLKSGYLALTDVTEDADGNYIAIGYLGGSLTIDKNVLLNNSDDITLNCTGSNDTDGIIIKLNPDGRVIFVDKIGEATTNDTGYLIDVQPDGTYIIVADVFGTIKFSAEQTVSSEEISVSCRNAIVHYDRTGKIIQVDRGTGFQGTDLLATSTGYLIGNITNAPVFEIIGKDVTCKTTNLANHSGITLYAVAITSNGEYIAAGYVYSNSGSTTISGDYTENGKEIVLQNENNTPDAVIIKYNADGKIINAFDIDCDGTAIFNSVKELPNGDYVAVGSKQGEMQISEANGYTYSDIDTAQKGLVIQFTADDKIVGVVTSDTNTNYTYINVSQNSIIAYTDTYADSYKIAMEKAPIELELVNKIAAKVVVHHYLKTEDGTKTTIKVADDEIKEGEIGVEYITAPKTDLKDVSLEKDSNSEYVIPTNATGNYTEEVQEIIYYYEPKDIILTINHYLEGSELPLKPKEEQLFKPQTIINDDGTYKISTNGTFDVDTNQNYNELKADYIFTKVISDVKENTTVEDFLEFDKNTAVTYYYQQKGHQITTQVRKHEELREDEITKEIVAKQVEGGTITGNYVDIYKEEYEIKFVETVDQKENSKTTIIAYPDQNYVVKQIELISTDDKGNQTKSLIYQKDTEQDIDKNAEISFIKNNDGTIKLTTFREVTEDKHIIVDFEPIQGTVRVHHYIEGTGEEHQKDAINVLSKDGNEIEDEIKQNYIGENYATKENENIATMYKLVSTSGQTCGEYKDGIIDVYYYYNYKEYEYKIEHYYEDKQTGKYIIDLDATEKGNPIKYGEKVEIKESDKKLKPNYTYEKQENSPLTITEDVEKNVIKLYYGITDYKYTIHYFYDNIEDENKKEEHSAQYGSTITTYTDNLIEEYEFEKVTPVNTNDSTKTNLTITENEEKNVINVYYKSKIPAIVKVQYLEEGTEKVLYTTPEGKEYQEINGYVNDKYSTSPKQIENYELVQEKYPSNSEGTMTEEEIIVKYYYKKALFNMKIEKEIEKVIVNGQQTNNFENNKLVKVAVEYKEIADTAIEISYKIKVTNTEKVAGTAIIEEYIPEGFEFVKDKSDENWKEENGKFVLQTKEIKPKQTKEYRVTLKWNSSEENKGQKENTAKIANTANKPNYEETTKQDNEDKAIVEIELEKTIQDIIDDVKDGKTEDVVKDIITNVKTGDKIIMYVMTIIIDGSVIIVMKKKK